MSDRRKQILLLLLAAAFGAFVGGSFLWDIAPGEAMGGIFVHSLWDMLKLLPPVFVMIALFDVWVKKETVERHLGKGSGLRGYLWAIVLASMTVGGMYIAFPVAYSLFRKGARLSVVFAFVGFAGMCRLPMTAFEISFLGPKFTLVRLGVSIPLVILYAKIMGRVLERRGYEVKE